MNDYAKTNPEQTQFFKMERFVSNMVYPVRNSRCQQGRRRRFVSNGVYSGMINFVPGLILFASFIVLVLASRIFCHLFAEP